MYFLLLFNLKFYTAMFITVLLIKSSETFERVENYFVFYHLLMNPLQISTIRLKNLALVVAGKKIKATRPFVTRKQISTSDVK